MKKNKNLCVGLNKKSGRSFGKISVRHIGNFHKKLYRKIDFFRKKINIYSFIERFDYDPNRNCYLALLKYIDGEKTYILKTSEMKINDKIITSYNKIKIKDGNSSFLKNIQIGTFINCIEKIPFKGAKFSRSGGNYSELIFKDNNFAIIKLSSGKTKKLSIYCIATIGKLCNFFLKKKMYKAGQNRWRGKRPTVRGVAMNPVDHPHGGGEGKTSGGRHPCTPWGKKTKGKKTKNV
ncbi:ribosomal protein L2 [Candidatus Carsonella ruddii CS isolate Thao2000]|uniref:Large ribosomal subunit protein uL2 n=1 Tax=Candidatus Carsonella ruddii CS isolate Thao2000 TaxID=1202537 RepID=J7GWJ4_CARRU|nr:50S ribosomal protein L2 [Candidatus Carsonella ruddii]AFP83826.1 ribosomal protein L2 [Candidatus Carsonella ruddii CS isolate Thao2000]